MGVRYRKSIKIAPGVRVNLGKKSASVSVGGKGYRKTFSTTGRTTTSVGIPGSGLSYTTTSGGSSNSSGGASVDSSADVPFRVRPLKTDKSKTVTLLLCIFLGYFGAHYFYAGRFGMGILYLCTIGLFGIGWIVDIVRICTNHFSDKYGRTIS